MHLFLVFISGSLVIIDYSELIDKETKIIVILKKIQNEKSKCSGYRGLVKCTSCLLKEGTLKET